MRTEERISICLGKIMEDKIIKKKYTWDCHYPFFDMCSLVSHAGGLGEGTELDWSLFFSVLFWEKQEEGAEARFGTCSDLTFYLVILPPAILF